MHSKFLSDSNTFYRRYCPVLILLLGALLRLLYLSRVPGGLHQDEAFVLLNSYDLLHEGRDSAGYAFPIYMSSWGDGQSAMYSWLLTPLLLLNKGIPTTFLGRLPQALVGILTLWCVYCLVKEMFGHTAGLWALFALSVCPWHIMACRWALDANMAPGFLMFGLYFFVRGMNDNRYLLLAALFYGLSLYCYAVIWPMLPILLALQVCYGIRYHKIHCNRYSVLSVLLLFVLALPLLLFVLVNQGLLPEIALPWITIPKTQGYRGGEIAFSLSSVYANFKNTAHLLLLQDTGSPYDFLPPWGLFYDIGRLFILIGIVCMLYRLIRSVRQHVFCWEFFLFAQLMGGGITSLLVTARMHQINDLYIPLVLCEAYGIWKCSCFLKGKSQSLGRIFTGCTTAFFLICLVLFQKDYYTKYAETTNAYFSQGVEDCVAYSMKQCKTLGLTTISAEKATQWPRLLLYTQTLPSQYLATVTYDVAPAPAAFTTADGIRVNTRINYDTISTDSIYIIYYTEADLFKDRFTLTPFYDWYVAVPK